MENMIINISDSKNRMETLTIINIYKAHGSRIIMDLMIGIRSISQMMSDINMATSGAMRNKSMDETDKMIIRMRNCALINPNSTFESLSFIKDTFSAVSSVKK